MTSPSLLSRESTTLSPRWPQNGHFIGASPFLLVLLVLVVLVRGGAGQVLQAADAQAILAHDHDAKQDNRHKRDRVRDDGRGDRLIVGRAKKRRHPDSISLVVTAYATWRGHRH